MAEYRTRRLGGDMKMSWLINITIVGTEKCAHYCDTDLD